VAVLEKEEQRTLGVHINERGLEILGVGGCNLYRFFYIKATS
jgi:hypothetical protein